MPEDFVQVTDGTGTKIRTRSRVIGANTVEEQYVIAVQSDAVPVNRVWLSTLRIPNRAVAAATSSPIFTLWNGIANGGNSVSVRRMSVEIDQSATIWANVSPQLRVQRMSTQAATPAGTVITPVAQYTPDVAFNSLVSIRADHQGDGASATTQLVAGTLGAQPMWSQTVPRMHSATGFQALSEYNLLPNDATLMAVDPLILRPQEGFAISLYNPHTAALTASLWTFSVKAVFAEFTYP